MNSTDRKQHWENVFQTKDTSQVSWYQNKPATSLQIIDELNIKKNASIIEVGSGDSKLADYLLEQGYCELSLLDISQKAINTVRKRLLLKIKNLSFHVSDIIQFNSNKLYDLWHDRAVFHFLSHPSDISAYVEKACKYIKKDGYLILATFSHQGPQMCSDLSISQYSEETLVDLFEPYFLKVKCFQEDHITPSGSMQNFLYCVLKRN